MQQEEKDFLARHTEFAFASVGEDNKPKLRIFKCMKRKDTTLYFATSPQKQIYPQLQNNPYVELLALEGNVSVRIIGKADFDVDDAICQEIYQTNDVLPRLYTSYRDLVYFKVPMAQLDYFDLSFTPPLFRTYQF